MQKQRILGLVIEAVVGSGIGASLQPVTIMQGVETHVGVPNPYLHPFESLAIGTWLARM